MKSHLALVLLALLLSACTADRDDEANGRLRVIATTTQIGDFARAVGGDLIDLTVLLKPNQDAHDFSLSPSQTRDIDRADLILRNGLGLDLFVLKAAERDPSRLVVVTRGIPLRDGPDALTSDLEAGGHDPHVWFSVSNARLMVENIRDAFVRADPANEAAYRENAARYLQELDALDARIRAAVAQVPERCRKLVTNHDTLGYFALLYGFEVIGSVIPSLSSEARPSAADVADIVRKIRDARVPAIFAETSINPSLIRQVGREAGVRVVDDLYGDSLGPRGSDGATYISMMEANTKKIVEALKDC
ncbi:MAG TPA: metal ABC transporter substrate-binding protein [Dehalococcoidia bacterium]|nr:metal ABC transporter substrate-binding protein [Dehalococcoidia bacterium]